MLGLDVCSAILQIDSEQLLGAAAVLLSRTNVLDVAADHHCIQIGSFCQLVFAYAIFKRKGQITPVQNERKTVYSGPKRNKDSLLRSKTK